MKKLILPIAVIALVSFSTSCKKEYTCECDGTAAGKGIETYTIDAKDEAEAKGICEGYADNTGGQVTCKLK